MPQLRCTVRRVGDHESRTEEYEVAYTAGQATPRVLHIKYQAREAIAEADPDQRGPTDEALSKFSWRTIQSAKYERGESRSSSLDY